MFCNSFLSLQCVMYLVVIVQDSKLQQKEFIQ